MVVLQCYSRELDSHGKSDGHQTQVEAMHDADQCASVGSCDPKAVDRMQGFVKHILLCTGRKV